MTKVMRKDVKEVLRVLRQYADPPSSFSMVHRKHLRVSWNMTNDDGEKVTVSTTIANSPSDRNWRKHHTQQLKRRFTELNISKEVTHI